MKHIWLVAVLLISFLGKAQTLSTYEKPPVFSECDSLAANQLKSCFYVKSQQVPDEISCLRRIHPLDA